MDDQVKLLQLERKFGVFGSTVGSRRWGALSAARPAKRRPPGGCWEAGEANWMLGRAFWRAWKGFGVWVDFWAEVKLGVCSVVLGLWWERRLMAGWLREVVSQ